MDQWIFCLAVLRNSICFPKICNLIPQLHPQHLTKRYILVEPDEQGHCCSDGLCFAILFQRRKTPSCVV